MKKESEFDITIDPYRLDEEWVRQPELYHEYAEKVADARQAYDDAKNEVEVLRAELYRQVTAAPETFGLAKTTEKALENAILAHPNYKKAVEVQLDAKHELAVLEAALSALDHRKKALEKLVELHVADYYSKPKARGASGRERTQEMESESFRRRLSRKRK